MILSFLYDQIVCAGTDYNLIQMTTIPGARHDDQAASQSLGRTTLAGSTTVVLQKVT